MGWNNPPVRWPELERALSGKPFETGDGGDSPAWTHHRGPYVPPPEIGLPGATDHPGGAERVPYAELHCHSNFSFLDGASHPEELGEAPPPPPRTAPGRPHCKGLKPPRSRTTTVCTAWSGSPRPRRNSASARYSVP